MRWPVIQCACVMHIKLPEALAGPYCSDPSGLPRYCATIWIDVLKGHLAPSTRDKYVSAARALYQQAESMVPPIDLDAALMAPNFPEIEAVLSANLLTRQADHDLRRWKLSCSFVFSILKNIVGSDSQDMAQRLRFMRQRFSQLSVRPRIPSSRVRAIPALALEDLYDVFHPESDRNPFRMDTLKWRNFVMFILLVQLGLRKGEILSLSVDALRDQVDLRTGEVKRWIDVSRADQATDPRARRPRMKTVHAVRQLPVSLTLSAILDTYVGQYRGDVDHGFLLSSSEGQPLALSSVDHVIRTAHQHMSQDAQAALKYEGVDRLSAHAFRHTAAVIRLQHFMEAGMEQDEALHRLRPFFGWSRSSEMPFLYARAYFEPRHSRIWEEAFETSLAFLRAGVR